MRAPRRSLLAALLVLAPLTAIAGEPIRLATNPSLSPDGSLLAFAYKGDIWVVASIGGEARRLTEHSGRDREPKFSPDGKAIAFTSDREGSTQVYIMSSLGGLPRQVTHHTAGHSLQGWFPDGKSLLVSATRDHAWKGGERFLKIKTDERAAEEVVFDDYGKDGSLSPDGKKLLFVREGAAWWRKGYKGSQAGQAWVYDLDTKAFTLAASPEGGALWPLWRPDSKGFYYVGAGKDGFTLRDHDFVTNAERTLTDFPSDSVVFPTLSQDGSTLVFRHLFDFYKIEPAKNSSPVKIEITAGGDATTSPIERRVMTEANDVAYSKDGLELAFTAGGDLWVMDTELMEPRRVTSTPEEERAPIFSPDGETLLFVSDQGGQADLWKAKRGDPKAFWWQNSDFPREKLTDDGEVETDPTFSPDGSKIAYLKSRGDLWIMNADGKESKKLLNSCSYPRFDWSPDSKWLTYSTEDEDFNRDIWLLPIDGSVPPYNLSRHPDNDDNPRWSPDGKVIAFTGRREDTEVDIYFIYLREEDDQTDRRDRTLEKAVEKMTKGRKQGIFTPGSSSPGGVGRRGAAGAGAARPAATPKAEEPKDEAKADEPKPVEPKAPTPPPKVVIDFERIHERIRRVSIPDANETGLFWSPDSKKLGFIATIEGKRGTYTVELPDDLKPKLLSAQPILQARWVEAGNQVLGLVGPPIVAPSEGDGVIATSVDLSPASVTAAGKETTFRVRAPQELDLPKHHRAGFEMAWRTMRDRFYDEKLGNRDWNAVRAKYVDMAEQAADTEAFATVVQLMLGELNGSHLGFMATSGLAGPGRGARGAGVTEASATWSVTTAHLGLRFVADDKGPGLLVRDVIPDGPTDHKKSRVLAGERLIKIDGVEIMPAMDLTKILNGPIDRDIKLMIRSLDGKDRDISIRPISYTAAVATLYDKWVKENRKAVETASKGTLGYLHIRGMSMPSFYKFEEDLYAAGSGKEGLIVDVRENGGGSTTDLLLTCLTQPVHAITIPRGGGPGYPQDRKVYASWSKPIVVLCNQNSFSNAEIFSHAIKTLKRGKLVGTPTAGGVISTGATGIMDLGTLRLPGRGWFLLETGEDMELNGAVPDVVLWPTPGDMPKGKDDQLAKALDVLSADVAAVKAQPRPKLRKATER